MTRYALVPETDARAWEHRVRGLDGEWSPWMPGPAFGGDHVEQRPLYAASPGQGAVTAEQLEAAAEAVHRNSTSGRAWSRMGEDWKAVYRTHARAALEALGLTVQP